VLFSWDVDQRRREFFFWLLLVVGAVTAFSSVPIYFCSSHSTTGHRANASSPSLGRPTGYGAMEIDFARSSEDVRFAGILVA
jgi:hypothetical protein